MKIEDFPTNDAIGEYGWVEILSERNSGAYSVHDGAHVEDITAERVARIDAWFADSPDGYANTDMAALVELTDGTWAAVIAWCDTTGWDCQSDVQWKWAWTRNDAITYGLDRSARARLGVSLPGEVATDA